MIARAAESGSDAFEPEKPRDASMKVVAVLGLGVFLTYLDANLITALFPAVLTSFGESLSATSWVINATNVGLATGLVMGGRIADAYGRRRVFVFGLMAYGSLCLLCGAAPVFAVLTAARVALGLSGALLLTSSFSLLTNLVPPERRAAAVGVYGALGGLGSIVGPLLATAVTAYASWRWSFLLLAPFCFAAAAVAARLPEDERAASPPRVDWGTGIAGGAAVGGLMLALLSGPRDGWASPIVVLGFVTAALGALLVTRREIRSEDPMLPRLLRNSEFALPVVGGFGMGFAFAVAVFCLPLFVTQVQAQNVSSGGIVLVPAALLSVVFAVAGGRLASRFGYRAVGGVGFALTTAWLFSLSMLSHDWSVSSVLLLSAAGGVGLGLGLPTMAGSALQSAGDTHAGVGTGWYNSARIVGAALGVVAFAVFSSERVGVDPAPARQWVEQELMAVTSPAQRQRVLVAFEDLTACTSPGCRNEILSRVADLEVAMPALSRGMQRELGIAFRTAILWCALASSVSLVGWLACLRLARASP